MAKTDAPADYKPNAEDGLAWPKSFEAKYGAGKKRGLVLGGGGVYFVAWQVAYLKGLVKRGVHLDEADVLVGTSAGSVIASIMASGGINRFSKQVDLMSHVPALIGMMAPASSLRPSQLQAVEMFRDAKESTPEIVKTIGFAALAAHTPAASDMRRSVSFAIAARGWPKASLHITGTDVYTAERLVITEATGISAIRAAAASSAVPGIFSPQPMHERFVMDGGVSGSGTHSDIVAGAEKALVISLTALTGQLEAGMTIGAGQLDYEMAGLDSAGTHAIARGPREVDLEQLMNPAAVPDALRIGDEQAAEDAEEIAAFFNS